jgi:carotenoid cleavage dioxygenase-like enzyme
MTELAASTSSAQEHRPWHLRGNWAPVAEEVTAFDLEVDGALPPELTGLYVRTGMNPKSGWSAHWFLGDGMVHGVRLEGGRAAWYRNRWVRTKRFEQPGVGGGLDDPAGGTGNTAVVAHAGRILALEEGHQPWEIDAELGTVGLCDFDGTLRTSLTAHPKVDPVTGELLAFTYTNIGGPNPLYLRFDATGRLVSSEHIATPGLPMMHDFAVTEQHVVFLDLPVCFSFAGVEAGDAIPFRWDPDYGARLGVLPRTGPGADVRWFEIDPCYVFHTVNAHDVAAADGSGRVERIVLDACRMGPTWVAGPDDFAPPGNLTRWTIDLTAGTVHEERIDDRGADFPRVDDRLVGRPARWAWLAGFGDGTGSGSVETGRSIYRYDLHTGDVVAARFPHGGVGEPVFAPAGPGAAEDEGWVLAYVHDESAGATDFVVLDASAPGDGPVARIRLPQRVPYGAHGAWIPDPS